MGASGEGIGPVNIVVAVPTADADKGLSQIKQKATETFQFLGNQKIPGLAWDAVVEDASRALKEVEDRAARTAANVASEFENKHWSTAEADALYGSAMTSQQFARSRNPYATSTPGLHQNPVGSRINLFDDSQYAIPGNKSPALLELEWQMQQIAEDKKRAAQTAKTGNIIDIVRQEQSRSPVDFSRMAAVDRSEWMSGYNKSERLGIEKAENTLSNFRTKLAGLPSDKLRAIEQHFERSAMSGKNVTNQLNVVREALANVGDEARQATGAINGMENAAEGKGKGGVGGQGGTGRGSDARQFRYVSQNLAYGFEDALTMYNMNNGGAQGARAAARAASNNISAFGTMIPSPVGAAAFIAGTAVVAASVGPIADALEKAWGNAKKAAEEYGKELDKLHEKTKSLTHFESLRAEGGSSASISEDQKSLRNERRQAYNDIDAHQQERSKKEQELAKVRDHQAKLEAQRSARADSPSGGLGNLLYLFYDPASKHGEAERLKAEMQLLDDQDAALSEQLGRIDEHMRNNEELEAKFKKAEETEARFKKERTRFFESLMANDGSTKPLTGEEMSNQLTSLYDAQMKSAGAEADPTTRKMLTESLQAGKSNEIDEASYRAEKQYEDYMRRQKKAADSLELQMLQETDARRGIVESYKKQRNEIEKMSGLSDERRGELLGLNSRAMEKRLSEFDKAERKKGGEYKPLELGTVGSRADAELMARYSAMGTDAKETKNYQKASLDKFTLLVAETKKTNTLLQTKTTRPANLR